MFGAAAPVPVLEPLRTEIIGRRHFGLLELGRFVAALLVALFHVDTAIHKFYGHYVFGNFFRFGHAGVEYFFVLSGFLIFWIHHRDVGKANRSFHFFLRRVIRIFPMYWLVVLAFIAAYQIAPALLQGRLFSYWDYVKDVFLLPRDGEMVLSVAWTLRQEFVFYGIMFFSILIRGIGLKLIIAWQLVVAASTLVDLRTGSPTLTAFLHTYNLGFGAGIAIAWWSVRQRATAGGPIIAAGAAMFLAVALLDWQMGLGRASEDLALGDRLGPLLYTLAAAVLIHGCVAYEMRHPSQVGRLVTVLGGASYLLYLTHGAVTSTLVRILRHSLAPNLQAEVAYALLIVTAIAAAMTAHILIERPVLRYLQSLARKI
jgi:exopolysaccharide production protein ExoZ